MSFAPFRTTTALVASLALVLPRPVFVSVAWSQEVARLCLDESQPPCPEGEPGQGSTLVERAAFYAAETLRLAAEAEETARLTAGSALAAEAEAQRLQQVATEAEAAGAAEAGQARLDAEAALEQAARAAAEAEAARIMAVEAAAAAEVARLASDEQVAAAELARLAAEAAMAEAEEVAAADAAAVRLAEEAVQAEGQGIATAQAVAAAEAEAVRLAEEEAAAVAQAEAQAVAAAEAEAQAAAEAEAQAVAAAEAEAVRLAEEAAAVAEAEAQAVAAAAAEAVAAAEAEALRLAAEAEAVRLAAEEAAAAAQAQAIAAAEAEAVRLAAEQATAAAQAASAADAEAARLAAAQAAAAAVAAQAQAAAEAEAARLASAQATAAAEQVEAALLAAQQAAAAQATAAAEASVVVTLVDPTVNEVYAAPAAAAPSAGATPRDVVQETPDARSVRTSTEDFATGVDGPSASGAQDNGLTNIEKALLLGLGAVVVGSVLRNGDRVVENSGDRVVVEGADGLTVYKDDDALLRQPGASMRTETYDDGSSRTILDREDGSQVVTIRDARGRVLRRVVTDPDGMEYDLFDDLQPEPEVNVRQLAATRPEPRRLSASESDLEALRAALREDLALDADRTFSLRQIREIEQVRGLVPAIELDTVTFPTGSAAIPPAQVRQLLRLGILIEELLLENPREMFLIEGHTDAVGDASQNLALSDRRAESVALALTETFHIAPENLIVQGYGEGFPIVESEAAEDLNRRVTARRITPLLRQMAEN